LEPLVDPYGRRVSSLRVSVTQRCDLACFFCHREGEHDPGKEMSPSEIGRLVEIASELGVTKVKVTGGEPLIRDDIVEVIRLISPHVREVSMTTNALLLPGGEGGDKSRGRGGFEADKAQLRRHERAELG
jgi:cyclic pyranopterin phosphate synthase